MPNEGKVGMLKAKLWFVWIWKCRFSIWAIAFLQMLDVLIRLCMYVHKNKLKGNLAKHKVYISSTKHSTKIPSKIILSVAMTWCSLLSFFYFFLSLSLRCYPIQFLDPSESRIISQPVDTYNIWTSYITLILPINCIPPLHTAIK